MLFCRYPDGPKARPAPLAAPEQASSATQAMTCRLERKTSSSKISEQRRTAGERNAPLSIISDESSGGVSCKTFLMTFIISLSSESMALTTSLVVISAVAGQAGQKVRAFYFSRPFLRPPKQPNRFLFLYPRPSCRR